MAHAKGEILSRQAPRPRRSPILNADDPYFDYWWRSFASGHVEVLEFRYSAQKPACTSDADIRATRAADGSDFELVTPAGTVDVRLGLTGEHNVRNACAAAAVALGLGVGIEDIAAGLGSVEAVGGRLAAVEGRNGLRVFDDSYNANPSSVVAAAAFLASLEGPHCFVLGDMGELGADEAEIHARCGGDIRAAGVDTLYTLGELSQHAASGFGSGAQSFDTLEALVRALDERLSAGTAVLVKGSRFMAMERVVAALTADAPVSTRAG